jgi:hypothetical protein
MNLDNIALITTIIFLIGIIFGIFFIVGLFLFIYLLIKFDCLNIVTKYTGSMITKLMNIPGISYILMPFVSTFNVLHDTYMHIKESVSHTYDVYMNYVSDSFNTWYFVTDMDYPVQAIYCRNLYEVAQWEYSRTRNLLKYIRSESANYIVGLPFVSIDISIKDGRIFNMDSIIEKFMYITDGVHIPTPQLLMNIWSVHSNILLTHDDCPIMTVITVNGDIETFPVFMEDGDENHNPYEWSEIFRENFEFETNDSSECNDSENHGDDEEVCEEDENVNEEVHEEVAEEEGQKENIEDTINPIEQNDDAEISTSNEVSSEEEEGQGENIEEAGVSYAHETNSTVSDDVKDSYNIIATPQLSATNATVVEASIPPINLTTPVRVKIESVDISIPSHVPDTPLKLKRKFVMPEDMDKTIQTFASIVNGVDGIEIDYSKVKDIIRNYPMANLQDKSLEEVD